MINMDRFLTFTDNLDTGVSTLTDTINPRVYKDKNLKRIRKLFKLSEDEEILDRFSCSLKNAKAGKKLMNMNLKQVSQKLQQGYLFVTPNRLCFYSHLLNTEQKAMIPFKYVTAIEKKTYGFLPNAIEVSVKERDVLDKKYIFATFLNRSEAFKVIERLWKQKQLNLRSVEVSNITEIGMDIADGEKAALEAASSRYKLVKRLGEGGFGSTYLVLDRLSNRQCALKRVNCGSAEEANIAIQEMVLLRLLKHPYIVGYRDYWRAGNVIFTVMEYAEGGDLSAIMEHRGINEYFSQQQVVRWICQLCLALNYMHSINTLHRDIKPGNVFFNRWNDVKLGDFGLSTVLKDGPSGEGLAETKEAVGTPGYAAPEVIQEKAYNAKSDIYGLGCTLFEMLTLKSVIDAQKANMFHARHVNTEVYDERLAQLLKKMLHSNPERRPDTQEILEHELIAPALEKVITEAEIYSELQQEQEHSEMLRKMLRGKEKRLKKLQAQLHELGADITLIDSEDEEESEDMRKVKGEEEEEEGEKESEDEDFNEKEAEESDNEASLSLSSSLIKTEADGSQSKERKTSSSSSSSSAPYIDISISDKKTKQSMTRSLEESSSHPSSSSLPPSPPSSSSSPRGGGSWATAKPSRITSINRSFQPSSSFPTVTMTTTDSSSSPREGRKTSLPRIRSPRGLKRGEKKEDVREESSSKKSSSSSSSTSLPPIRDNSSAPSRVFKKQKSPLYGRKGKEGKILQQHQQQNERERGKEEGKQTTETIQALVLGWFPALIMLLGVLLGVSSSHGVTITALCAGMILSAFCFIFASSETLLQRVFVFIVSAVSARLCAYVVSVSPDLSLWSSLVATIAACWAAIAYRFFCQSTMKMKTTISTNKNEDTIGLIEYPMRFAELYTLNFVTATAFGTASAINNFSLRLNESDSDSESENNFAHSLSGSLSIGAVTHDCIAFAFASYITFMIFPIIHKIVLGALPLGKEGLLGSALTTGSWVSLQWCVVFILTLITDYFAWSMQAIFIAFILAIATVFITTSSELLLGNKKRLQVTFAFVGVGAWIAAMQLFIGFSFGSTLFEKE